MSFSLEVRGHANPKDEEKKRREASSPVLTALFVCFFSSP